jgi:hypothetical protein
MGGILLVVVIAKAILVVSAIKFEVCVAEYVIELGVKGPNTTELTKLRYPETYNETLIEPGVARLVGLMTVAKLNFT